MCKNHFTTSNTEYMSVSASHPCLLLLFLLLLLHVPSLPLSISSSSLTLCAVLQMAE